MEATTIPGVTITEKNIKPRNNLVVLDVRSDVPITTLMDIFDNVSQDRLALSRIPWVNGTVISVGSGIKDINVGDSVIMDEKGIATYLDRYISHELDPTIIYNQYKIPVGADKDVLLKKREELNTLARNKGTVTVGTYLITAEYNVQAIIDNVH
jgi:hypothetical protein